MFPPMRKDEQITALGKDCRARILAGKLMPGFHCRYPAVSSPPGGSEKDRHQPVEEDFP